MDKKIFISHSATDSEIGEKFLEFLISLGYDKKNIFYSSKYHQGVELGKNFPDVVRDSLVGSDIIVLLLTENFYKSYYCVCEEGAAWISKDKEIVPVLLGDLTFSDMKGFIDSSTKSFSPKQSETEELFSYFAKRTCAKQDIDIINAKKKYYDFIECSVNHQDSRNTLTKKENEILEGLRKIPSGLTTYFDTLNTISLTLNGKNVCENLDLPDRLEYREAVEHLVELGLIKKKSMFISITAKGTKYDI